MTYERKESGRFGEQMAMDFLQRKGMTLLEQNYTCRLGEIDLVFRDGETLVFVEVKLRFNSFFGPAALAVTSRKQRKIATVAKYYMMERKLIRPLVRFDVIGVEKENEKWTCKYYRNAFYAPN